MKNTKGFTLIEVLIAVVILAIAFLAIMQTTQSNIRSAIHIEKTLTASWVADNVLASLQLGLISAPKPGADTTGKIQMLNHTWSWKAATHTISQDNTFQQVEISVFLNGKQVQNLTGFITREKHSTLT